MLRNIVAGGLSLASLACVVAAFRFPFVEGILELHLPDFLSRFGMEGMVRRMLIEHGGLQVGPMYLRQAIQGLFDTGSPVLGVLVTLFSVVLPVGKALGSLLLIPWLPRYPRSGYWLRKGILFTSKWAAADVFIVALIIVLFKAETLAFRYEPRVGIYYYAAAAVLSSLAVACLPYISKATPMERERDDSAPAGLLSVDHSTRD